MANYQGAEISRAYSEMCMGLEETSASNLSCYYIHHNNPRLLVAPFKAEELHLYPPILMFHDVISDKEITDMKISFFSFVSTRILSCLNEQLLK